MRDWDLNGHKLCEYQAALFEESLLNFSGSSCVFIRLFMNGKIAKFFDDNSILNFSSGFAYSDLMLPKSNGKLQGNGKTKLTRNEMHWLGFIYRYWCYTRALYSRQVYSLMPGSKLVRLYLPLHTQDPEAALQTIEASLAQPLPKDINARLKALYHSSRKAKK